jgi:hypothetical protein
MRDDSIQRFREESGDGSLEVVTRADSFGERLAFGSARKKTRPMTRTMATPSTSPSFASFAMTAPRSRDTLARKTLRKYARLPRLASPELDFFRLNPPNSHPSFWQPRKNRKCGVCRRLLTIASRQILVADRDSRILGIIHLVNIATPETGMDALGNGAVSSLLRQNDSHQERTPTCIYVYSRIARSCWSL